MTPRLVIGIAGGSGSGKTTPVERLVCGPYAAQISILPHDAYYHDAVRMPPTDDLGRNWDHPSTSDNDLYLDHVSRLLGQAVEQPVYDFARDCRSTRTVEVLPAQCAARKGFSFSRYLQSANESTSGYTSKRRRTCG